jgi:hypothetical protein
MFYQTIKRWRKADILFPSLSPYTLLDCCPVDVGALLLYLYL